MNAPTSRIHLRPAAAGVFWLAATLALLATAINYGSNLLFALCFVLLATWLQSAWECRRNLAAADFCWASAQPAVFAGEQARLTGALRGAAKRLALCAGRDGHSGEAVSATADEASFLHLDCPAPVRGRMRYGQLRLASRYPLGLWRAWRAAPDASVLVYPKPAEQASLPEDSGPPAQSRAETGDFQGLRAYAPGDRMNRINWRAFGRSGELQVNVFDGGAGGAMRWLDEAQCSGGLEQRLAQLTAWVLAAEQQGCRYGLALVNLRVPPGHGVTHRAACLEALALYGREEMGDG